MRSNQRGFTLIEMMITLAVLGIIVAIAVPSYKQYVIRNNRAAVQAEMLQIAALMERYKSQQLTYLGANNIVTLYGANGYPRTGARLYTFNLQPSPNGVTWVLTALPEGTQLAAQDGALMLDNAGRRCWSKASQTSCDLADPAQGWSTR